MPRRCVCCSLPPEPGSASRVKRWRSAHYEPMTDRNQQRGTTTSCWRTIRSVGWCNERRDGSRATGHDPTVCQATAAHHDRRADRTAGQQAGKEKPEHLSYLEAVLGGEVEDRYRNAVAPRIKDAHFPKGKAL